MKVLKVFKILLLLPALATNRMRQEKRSFVVVLVLAQEKRKSATYIRPTAKDKDLKFSEVMYSFLAALSTGVQNFFLLLLSSLYFLGSHETQGQGLA